MSESRKDRPWSAEDVFLLLLVPASSVGAWFLPDEHLRFVLAILAVGVVFDLLSLLYHVLTLVTGKFMSAFPLVGLLFYGWFLLAYRKSLVAPHEERPLDIVAYKLLDLLILCGLHLLCQIPMAFQGPREGYK